VNTILQLVVSGFLIGSIYALMSIGLTLIFGVLRVVNFAHGEFLMIAMYGAWAISRLLGVNPYFAAIAVVPAMFLFGALVYRLVIGPGLAKPHLVLVFATMGLSIFLQNIALMAHIQLRRKSGQRILPVFYSDNYVSLVPGASKTIDIDAAERDFHGEGALVVVDGWNVTVAPASFAAASIKPNLDAQPDRWPATGLPFATAGLR